MRAGARVCARARVPQKGEEEPRLLFSRTLARAQARIVDSLHSIPVGLCGRHQSPPKPARRRGRRAAAARGAPPDTDSDSDSDSEHEKELRRNLNNADLPEGLADRLIELGVRLTSESTTI